MSSVSRLPRTDSAAVAALTPLEALRAAAAPRTLHEAALFYSDALALFNEWGIRIDALTADFRAETRSLTKIRSKTKIKNKKLETYFF